jgi:hypothetical protein
VVIGEGSLIGAGVKIIGDCWLQADAPVMRTELRGRRSSSRHERTSFTGFPTKS